MFLSDEIVRESAREVQSMSRFESPFEHDFFGRVFNTPHKSYRMRLNSIGLSNKGRVLDAGCGFGQWSVALAESNYHTVSMDVSPLRCSALYEMSRLLGIGSISTLTGDMDSAPFPASHFDAIFCYSSTHFGNWRQKVAELVRVLRPGGLLYINTNALGWYLYNLVRRHNDSDDFSSRRMALDSIVNSMTSRVSGSWPSNRQSIIQPRSLCDVLRKADAVILQLAPDGRIGEPEDALPHQFFAPKQFGLTSVYEILATK